MTPTYNESFEVRPIGLAQIFASSFFNKTMICNIPRITNFERDKIRPIPLLEISAALITYLIVP